VLSELQIRIFLPDKKNPVFERSVLKYVSIKNRI
jgi:hypothetical protein